jgi:putative ABC transport system permease protein
MLIGVSERRREIGIRRAAGASRGDILYQFLLEALLVSTFGGVLGVFAGLGGANVVATMQKLPLIFSRDALLRSLAVAFVIGLAFGIYPAWQASKVDPVNALRS